MKAFYSTQHNTFGLYIQEGVTSSDCLYRGKVIANNPSFIHRITEY